MKQHNNYLQFDPVSMGNHHKLSNWSEFMCGAKIETPASVTVEQHGFLIRSLNETAF